MILELAIAAAIVVLVVGTQRWDGRATRLDVGRVRKRLDDVDRKLDDASAAAGEARAASSAALTALNQMHAAALRLGRGPRPGSNPGSAEITGSWKAIPPPSESDK